MRKPLAVSSFRARNFKAIRDSGTIRFTPLTAFIGNNGSGKSSIIEGLEMLQAIVKVGLDAAVLPWHGFEHIWHQGTSHKPRRNNTGRLVHSNPMQFDTKGRTNGRAYAHQAVISASDGGNDLLIKQESYTVHSLLRVRRLKANTDDYKEYVEIHDLDPTATIRMWLRSIAGDESIVSMLRFFETLSSLTLENISEWQFLSMVPSAMVLPVAQTRTRGTVRLSRDGSNVAEYLLSTRDIDSTIIDGIVEALRFVLPYAVDMQPSLKSELQRSVYVQLAEQDFKLPGWLLSTGTIRILALLALLRHPNPPPLIVIEEIENGLDPRTIGLIVEEIRSAVQSGRTQVIVTTHSPYLLDLLPLSSIVVVDRDSNNSPTFSRPADDQSLKLWSDRFSPGQLYTMDRLTGRSK